MDARAIDTAIKSLITHFVKKYGNIEDIRKAFSANRIEWRDNLLKQEKNLVRVIKETSAHEDAKVLIANTVLEFSERLIVLAHKDIVKPEKELMTILL